MKDWKKITLQKDASILEAIKVIDSGGQQAAFVIDDSGVLIGSVTDGDIRRGILKGIPFSDPVQQIMNKSPKTAKLGESPEQILEMMKAKSIKQIPIIDKQNRMIGIETITSLLQEKDREHWIILMAGGTGSRLYPLTKETPKPLLSLGDKPILQIIIENFVAQGFKNIFLSVNFKAEMIESHFGNGSEFNCNIRYLRESESMGTAGSLSLLPERPTKPIIVMNGDLLTKVDFGRLLEFHEQQGSVATMCVREYDLQVPYGVVDVKDDQTIHAISEKPVHKFFVNGGIYALSPEILELVPAKERTDMTSLFEAAIAKKKKTSAFALREYWLDIGRLDDFERAQNDYRKLF